MLKCKYFVIYQPNEMRRISSKNTYFNKKVFPIIWFGFIGLWTCIAAPVIIHKGGPFVILVGPIFMIIFGYFLMRFLVFPLADEVYIFNDEIVVRNKGDEDRFPISEIINVDSSIMVNPPRITLTLRNPSKFGKEIIFSPPVRLFNFSRHPIAEELIERAQMGRS
jgi:hypothetical protein